VSPDRGDQRPDDELEIQDYADDVPRSVFATTWFRAIIVIVALGVVGVLALPYLLDWVKPSNLSPTPKGPVVSVPSLPRGSAETPMGVPAAPPASPPAPPAPATPTPQVPSAAPKAPEPSPAPSPGAPARGRAPSAAPAQTAAVKHESAKAAAKPRPRRAAAAKAAGPFWVQVGAFRGEEHAKALVAKLQADNFRAEEVAVSGGAAETAGSEVGESAPGDKYDVFVSVASPADVNVKLTGKGLSADPVAGGPDIKPSLQLRDAVALSKDLAVEGLKVQVRRAPAGVRARPPAGAGTASGNGLFRVRVGSFPDRSAAEAARKALAAKGYAGFISRGGG